MKKFVSFFSILMLAVSIFCESRSALLIANGKYKNFSSLATPIKEAEDLRKSLEKLGFSVMVLENAGKEEMMNSLYEFEKFLQKSGGIGFFHYGGHAVQVNGKNYLIPVDAEIPDERRVANRTVDVDEVMMSMQGDTNIVILDACRNNPLPAASGRSASRGLVLSETKPKNSIIVYSAQPGMTAQDGVFTPSLTKRIVEKKSLETILKEVRKDVQDKTGGEQSPGEYNELVEEVYLAGISKESPSRTEISRNEESVTSLSAVMIDEGGKKRTVLHPKDVIRFKVSSPKSVYVAILCIDADGDEEWLPLKNNFIRAGESRIFPDTPGMVLRVQSGTYGEERVIVYAAEYENELPTQKRMMGTRKFEIVQGESAAETAEIRFRVER